MSNLASKNFREEIKYLEAENLKLKEENEKLKEEVNRLHKELDIPNELMNLPYQEFENVQRNLAELNNVKKRIIATNLLHLSVMKSNGLKEK